MMKSFFKKLAFVMALAMVVTMAAPAGTAAFAADFYIADEANKKAETFKLEIGEKEDFSFKNALDHKNYTWTWESSDKTVATVDKSGIVTGVADGVATITVKGGDKYAASVVVTVGKGNVVAGGAYTVKQTTATEIEVYFDGKTSYTKDDIKLEFILDVEADYRVQWPIETVKEIENGFKIKPYVNFSNGDTYVITVGAEDKGTTFQTIFGAPDRIEVSYSCNKEAGKAYVSTEEDEARIYLATKFFSGDVDVTSITDASTVDYSAILNTDEDNTNSDSDDNGYYITVSATGVGVIMRATYVYVDDNDEEVVLTADTDVITAVKAPEYVIKGVVNWSIVDATTEKIDWNKVDHDISAFDDADRAGCKIVVLIVDSEGNYFVSDDRFIDPENKIYGSLDLEDSNKYGKFAQKGYSVSFASSDTSKMLVGTDGSLTTYTEATVPVIVSLHNSNIEDDNNLEQFVKYVGAPSVAVTKKRSLKTITADAKEYKVLSDALDGSYTEGTITLTLKDQFGELWTKETEVTIAATVNKKTVSIFEDNTVDYDPEDEKLEITIDGEYAAEALELVSATDKVVYKTVDLVFSVGNVKLTGVKVKVSAPKVDADGNVVTKKEQLTATNVVTTVTKDSEIPAKNEIKLNVFNTDTTTYPVGHKTEVYLFDKSATYTADNVTAGAYYLQVIDPKENKVGLGGANTRGVYASEPGVFHLTAAATESGNKISYLEAGTYTAKLVKPSVAEEDGKVTWTDVKNQKVSFTVGNTNSEVQFTKVKTGKTQTSEITKKAIVVDTLEFSLNGKNWAITENDIESVEVKYNGEAGTNEGYVIITKVKFRVPVDGGLNDAEGMNKYYIDEVEVNKAIELMAEVSPSEMQ